MRNSHVVIEVENLKLQEKKRILYNHLRLGGQPSEFGKAVRPFLSLIAACPNLFPEVARRLGERVLPFPPDQSGPVLADVNGYPRWYSAPLRLYVRAVTADGIGLEVELRPQGGRAFRCHVESPETPYRLRLRYPGDFIVGTTACRW